VAFREIRFQVFHETELRAVRFPNPTRPWVVVDTKYSHAGRRGRIVAHYRLERKARERARNMNFLHNGGTTKLPFVNRYLVFVWHPDDKPKGILGLTADVRSKARGLEALKNAMKDKRLVGHVFDMWQRKIIYHGADGEVTEADEPIYGKVGAEQTPDGHEGWQTLIGIDGLAKFEDETDSG
jgi:hypothetical protein